MRSRSSRCSSFSSVCSPTSPGASSFAELPAVALFRSAVESKQQPLRNVRAAIFWTFCGVALLLIIAPAIDIIVSVLAVAAPALKPSLISQTTSGGHLGLQNAITGTLTLSLGVLLTAGPVGILGGLYIAEFAPQRVASTVRFFSEVLAGVPSIVIGYVGYVVLVVGLHWGFSLLGGILALGALILPYIIKTTELAFSSVPSTLRE